MGYLSQKKKQTNIKELLNISLGIISFCCFAVLFFEKTAVAIQISHWLFQIYFYTLFLIIYAFITKFYWQGLGLMLCASVMFFNIGMGGNLFSDIKTNGAQELTILYQTDTHHSRHSLKQAYKHKTDIAAVLKNSKGNIKTQSQSMFKLNKKDGGIILTPHSFQRSGEVLLSPNSRAAFVDLTVEMTRMVFIALDFSKISLAEQKTSLRNLAEFINMQDVPVIVVGSFGQEVWSTDFLDFLEKTKLEVKNKIILSDGKLWFNPFKIPTINILAYKDFGIEEMHFLPAKKKDTHPLLIKLNY